MKGAGSKATVVCCRANLVLGFDPFPPVYLLSFPIFNVVRVLVPGRPEQTNRSAVVGSSADGRLFLS